MIDINYAKMTYSTISLTQTTFFVILYTNRFDGGGYLEGS